MPRAIPLTTTSPAAASSRVSERATERPYAEHALAPTTATAARSRIASSPPPRRKSTEGGSWIAARSGGYAGSRRRRHLTALMPQEALPASGTRVPRRRGPVRQRRTRRARRWSVRRARREPFPSLRAAGARLRSREAPTPPPSVGAAPPTGDRAPPPLARAPPPEPLP